MAPGGRGDRHSRRRRRGSTMRGMAAVNLHDPFTAIEDTVYPAGALSLYLPALPDHLYDARYHEHLFRTLVREHLGGAADELAVAVLRRERPRVVAHLRSRTVPAGHALAVFAYEPYGLLRSWCLPGDEAPLLAIGTRLRLDPIRRMLERDAPAIVVAVDKEEARIFRLVLGEVEELAELEGDEVKRHRQGGWSSLTWQRRADHVARHNLERTARWLNTADLDFYPRLHLAGPEEARSELKQLLLPGVRARLGSDLALPMYLSPGEMANRVRTELSRPARALP
jgi:release factor family 10